MKRLNSVRNDYNLFLTRERQLVKMCSAYSGIFLLRDFKITEKYRKIYQGMWSVLFAGFRQQVRRET